jgi:hypothetical protein
MSTRETAPPPRKWAPIATAPLDGRDLLVVYPEGRQLVARWVAERAAWLAIGDLVLPVPLAWQDLPEAPDPDTLRPEVPVLTSLVPDTAVLGDPNFTLHVHGTGFADDATILWNGSPEPTTVVSPTEVTTGVNMATAAVAMPIPVAVQNGNGAQSNTLTFTLTAPAAKTKKRDA